MRDFFRPGRSPVHAAKAAVATSHPMATATGLEILRAGGNAVDAAVAAVAVQSVVDPLMTGIGGDCFALLAPRGAATPVALNGSGRAPQAADCAWFAETGAKLSATSPHAVTVPGAVAAWSRLVRDYGRMSFADVLRPAIDAAEEGYLVQPRVAADWERFRGRLAGDADAAEVFLIDGQVPKVGARMRNPRLAAALRGIAQDGPAYFYEGPIAGDLVGKLQALGGLHTMEDFARGRAEYVVPIHTTYRGYEVFECPPNGQGVTALMILNILQRFDIAGLSEADRTHLFAEASKIAYHHRDAHVADVAATEILLSQAWAEAAAGRIDMARASEPALLDETPHADTVYLCVVDAEGNAISLINSIFEAFGSGIMGPRSGVLLHNRGQSFRLDPDHPNAIAPGKRPMHTIIPGMLMKGGRCVAPFGVMGGHYQAMGHAELLSAIIDRGLDVQEALDAPRSFAMGATLELEPSIGPGLAAEMARRGHRVARPALPLGSGQIIWIDESQSLIAGSDPRKDGVALGY